jgi:hypothetical protein
MKTLILALLTFAPLAQAGQNCLPIYITNSGFIQGTLQSEPFQAVDADEEMALAEGDRADISQISIKRPNSSYVTVIVTFKASNSGREMKASFVASQTCEGTIDAFRQYGTPAP